MEEQKLVLQEGTYKYDFETAQVSVSEDELRKAGYVKLADDETVVKKVKLSEDEARFMESHKHLSFYEFSDSASIYVKSNVRKTFGGCAVERRLNNAYFNGYTVKEPKYYIEFPDWFDLDSQKYLAVYSDGFWEFNGRFEGSAKRQFTLSEISELQKDDRAKGLDFNALKVRVPDGELAD